MRHISGGSIRSEVELLEGVLQGAEPITEAKNKKPIFGYYINKNERGEFYADVRNEDGETVYEIRSDEETGEVPEVEDGHMRNERDIQGLEWMLKKSRVIPSNGELYTSRDFESELDADEDEEQDESINHRGRVISEGVYDIAALDSALSKMLPLLKKFGFKSKRKKGATYDLTMPLDNGDKFIVSFGAPMKNEDYFTAYGVVSPYDQSKKIKMMKSLVDKVLKPAGYTNIRQQSENSRVEFGPVSMDESSRPKTGAIVEGAAASKEVPKAEFDKASRAGKEATRTIVVRDKYSMYPMTIPGFIAGSDFYYRTSSALKNEKKLTTRYFVVPGIDEARSRRAVTESKDSSAAVEKAAQDMAKASMDATKAEDPDMGTVLQMVSGALLRLSSGDSTGAGDALEQATAWIRKLPGSSQDQAPVDAASDEPTEEEIKRCFGLGEDREITALARSLSGL